VLEAMGQLLTGRDRDDYIFVTSRGARPLAGANWRIVWYAALDAANAELAEQNRALPPAKRIPPIPRLDPHDCRHTCASWQAQAGTPLYDIQALLGHESHQTTQRYSHLLPDRHDPIEKAWKTILAHVRRTDDESGRESNG
jgi:integrase